MPAQFYSTCKRPVNLTLSEGLVAQAKTNTDNLSATTELWNNFLSDHGSFAEEYCRL